jgi:hypothetical protein
MLGFDVGYDGERCTFILRSPTGELTRCHPRLGAGEEATAYSPDGDAISPLWPPPDSSWVLAPESSGAWCYHDTATGAASWAAPAGSSEPVPLSLPIPEEPFDGPPPMLDRELTLESLRRSGWLAIYRDAQHTIDLRHELTGAVRAAPWISLRTAHGRIFFANLVSRETRWFPPHLWMESWLSRAQHTVDSQDDTGAEVRVLVSSDSHQHDRSLPPPRSLAYTRWLLPPAEARRRVEGGAPYFHSGGPPRYGADEWDTEETYPMGGEQLAQL